MSNTNNETKVYGMLAEYDNADALIAGIKKAKEAGYTKLDGYSPYAVSGIADALGFIKSEMATVMLCGGICGAICGFLMQYYTNAVDYPFNIGGKPYNSWPMFIPVTYEPGILTTCLAGVFGLLALCGLPKLYNPLFNVPAFERSTIDRFFLFVQANDEKFDLQATREFLLTLNPLSVAEVPE